MYEIHHLTTINAVAEKVYEAISTEQGLKQWWTADVEITGLDANFKPAYKTEFSVDIDRAAQVIISLKPGNFHRTPFRIAHLQKTLPKNVKYIALKWTLNQNGTKLPEQSLETTIYELRKNPNKPDPPDKK